MQPGRHRPFEDRLPDSFTRPGVNPYVVSHRTFGDEIIPGSDAASLRGRWADVFGRAAPLHLEIGSGNGFYLAGMAGLHPEADWIGVEIRFKRVVLAAKKIRAGNIANARVARYDARDLDTVFEPGSLAGIHVNHPDPWERDSKRHYRLIDRAFAEMAARLLAPGAELRLRTDFQPHVTALRKVCEGLPFAVLAVRTDLDAEGPPWPDDVVTNYQRKARERGVPVHAAWLRRT